MCILWLEKTRVIVGTYNKDISIEYRTQTRGQLNGY